MENEQAPDIVQQALRIAGQFISGYLVANGLATASHEQAIIGGVVAIGLWGWWLYWNRKRSKA